MFWARLLPPLVTLTNATSNARKNQISVWKSGRQQTHNILKVLI